MTQSKLIQTFLILIENEIKEKYPKRTFNFVALSNDNTKLIVKFIEPNTEYQILIEMFSQPSTNEYTTLTQFIKYVLLTLNSK